MYKVTVTADGTTADASKNCSTKSEAEAIREKLARLLIMPVQIDIVPIGGTR